MDRRLQKAGLVTSDDRTHAHDVLGTITLSWYGSSFSAEVIFAGCSKYEPNELQISAFCDLIARWDDVMHTMRDGILANWTQELAECGHEPEYNALCPSERQLANRTELTGIIVSYMNGQEWCNYIGLLAECSWSLEHGLGVRIVDGRIVEIGYQDIVI
jgi:hypothetical protein